MPDQPREIPQTGEFTDSMRGFLRERVEKDFTYHAPNGDQAVRYNQLREKAKEFAFLIAQLTPFSTEQSEALSLLNLALMSANAAIARNE